MTQVLGMGVREPMAIQAQVRGEAHPLKRDGYHSRCELWVRVGIDPDSA